MQDHHAFNPHRRRMIRVFVAAAAVAPAAGLLLRSGPAGAQDVPHLTEDDPQAMALHYRHDYSEVDAGQFPNVASGGPDGGPQKCDNCQLLQGTEGDEWRPCAIFPGKLVNADGWCQAWVVKAG